jgi:tetratricopeptide (TPR) repeat protein
MSVSDAKLEAIMRSELAQQWIRLSRAAISDNSVAIPLIDERLPFGNLDEELHHIWNDGDSDLRADFEAELLSDPSNMAVRFASLNAYYHLMEHRRSQEQDDMLGILEEEREGFRKKLAYFVGFQPTEICVDLRTIRWEIVSACAAKEFDRAIRLCDSLQGKLPNWQISLVRGRLSFLVVHMNLWGGNLPLSMWDFEIGPEADDVGRAFTRLGVMVELISRDLPNEFTREAKASLRLAIADLENAIEAAEDISIEGVLMLARCYAAVDQYHQAARYFGMARSRQTDLRRCFEKPILRENLPLLESSLFHRTVTAHQRAEELDLAIAVCQDWIDEFPKSRDCYPLMARLHEERGDLREALAWHRKGEEQIPDLGNDWKTSLILKIGETLSPAHLDREIKSYIASNKVEIQGVCFVLDRHWTTFARMDTESKERWSTGISFLKIGCFGLAVHAFSGVLERAIRECVFIPFRDECDRNPALVANIGLSISETKPFCDFLLGKVELAFGQMLYVVQKCVIDRQGPFGPFASWLQGNFPDYYKRIGKLDEHLMKEFRNREDHFKAQSVTEAEAEKMLSATKEMLTLVFLPRSIALAP